MNKSSIVLITKDECPCNLLPVYGNKTFCTPNINELASKGTVFLRHHTGAPSTWMSYICMFTGKFAYETDLHSAIRISRKFYKDKTLFDKAKELGYECHIFWDESWQGPFRMKNKYIDYDRSTIIHSGHIKQSVGAHYIHYGEYLKRDKSKTDKALHVIGEFLLELSKSDKQIFLWIHLPHLFDGYTAWGEDIECFDAAVGTVRKYFLDENIYISSDHGDMCGTKGVYGYGYHVYEQIAHIPLISPKINNIDTIDYLTSNVDLYDLIFNKSVKRREFIYCESQLCAQPLRKLAIFKDNYKYIYNKNTQKEELYDLDLDPNEDRNMISDYHYDENRCVTSPLRELYYYPYWDKVEEMREVFRNEKNRIWKDGEWYEELILKAEHFVNMHGLKRWKRRRTKKPKIK